MRILIDTCAFLWIATDSPRLSEKAASAFLDRDNERYFSAASAWEIGIKHAARCLPLPQRPDVLIPALRDASGIESLEIDEESACKAARLPSLHSDPFDSGRRVGGCAWDAILTPDPEIEQSAVRVLW